MDAIFVLLCSCYLTGVFGDSVSVTEGDSVTLNISVTEISEADDVLWKFGSEKVLIANFNKKKQTFSINDGPDGRFRGRLRLDKHTGSLTITDITSEHAGDYEAMISGVKLRPKQFKVSVYGASVSPALIVLITIVAAGALLLKLSVVIFCLCKKRRNVETEEEDRMDLAQIKPKTWKMKSKEGLYENV